jgi:photosystem II stability/assembly factor-like uncharacterized protein
VGSHGLIAHCRNDKDWDVNEPVTDHDILSLFFLDDHTGWMSAYDYQIFSYIAPENRWEKIFYNKYNAAFDMYFEDGNTGWYASREKRIYRTSNGGHDWILQTEPGSYSDGLVCIDFVDSDSGWAAGRNRKILHTSDGGVNWGYTGYQAPFEILSIDFVDSRHGWAVGGQGGIIHATNWGWGWEEQDSPTMATLISVCFVDTQNGWICGEFGKILHTQDGGQTWIKQNSKTNNNLHSIMFTDRMNGWAAGEAGVIIHTVDGGENWYPEESLTENDLYVVFASDPRHCWTGGELGTLLYADYTNWTGINEIPDQTSIRMNAYPNPFSDYLEIDLFGELPESIMVMLMDINGKVIRSMSTKNNGSSGIFLDTKEIAQGIYLLQIEGNNFHESIKVIKLNN